jgi:hypothetical protein
MKAFLAILLFFCAGAARCVMQALLDLALQLHPTMPDSSPGGPSRARVGCAGHPSARPDRNHLGRKRRRAARRDREAAGAQRRSLALRRRLSQGVSRRARGFLNTGGEVLAQRFVRLSGELDLTRDAMRRLLLNGAGAQAKTLRRPGGPAQDSVPANPVERPGGPIVVLAGVVLIQAEGGVDAAPRDHF